MLNKIKATRKKFEACYQRSYCYKSSNTKRQSELKLNADLSQWKAYTVSAKDFEV
ncbi:hypothetical protein HYD87_03945 [Mycoplasmopsis bovis]|nr:hypothetical protein [Mycoplasmopsis bovis]QQH36536.1 hypothetical protein HYD87_03945 [Mycoplasmopsis bovis]